MKTDDEMLQSILSRFDEYQEQKKKRLLARKFRLKKLCSGLALAAATVCGCMTLCFGGYAMWNYVVKPIIIEEKQPEQPVTTQTAIVTQAEKPTELTETTTTVTEMTTTVTKMTTVETTKAITTVTEPVTEMYEENVYTEPMSITTVSETTTVTTTTETVTTMITTTTKMYDRYLESPTHMQSLILTSKGTYQVRKHCIDKSELDNYEITWKDDYSLYFFEDSPVIKPSYDLEFTDTIEIMGVNDEEDPDKYIIAYFPLQDVYALYELLPDSMEEGLKLWNEKRNGGDTDG